MVTLDGGSVSHRRICRDDRRRQCREETYALSRFGCTGLTMTNGSAATRTLRRALTCPPPRLESIGRWATFLTACRVCLQGWLGEAALFPGVSLRLFQDT